MNDWNALLQARLEAEAAESREREWRAVQDAIRERDMPIISGVRLRVVPTWEDDVLPRFRRWNWAAQRFSFGEWAKQDLLGAPKSWE